MDAAAERLIHSVNAVTDLLKANTELRDTIEKMRRTKEDSDAEVFTLNIENQTLRERLELVEGILKNNRENYENMVSDKVKNIMQKSNTQYGKFNMNAQLTTNEPSDKPDFTIDAVYTELIQLRQQNRVLETRIKQLEFQNFNMTRSAGFNVQANGPMSAGKNNPNIGSAGG
jgi:regulator of replication initiation timing